jgi:hypothetical protein
VRRYKLRGRGLPGANPSVSLSGITLRVPDRVPRWSLDLGLFWREVLVVSTPHQSIFDETLFENLYLPKVSRAPVSPCALSGYCVSPCALSGYCVSPCGPSPAGHGGPHSSLGSVGARSSLCASRADPGGLRSPHTQPDGESRETGLAPGVLGTGAFAGLYAAVPAALGMVTHPATL